MSEEEMLIIKVPGSSANLGPGFDSIGLALNLYLTLEVERADKWEVIPLSEELADFPKDEQNLLVQIALETAEKYGKQLPGCSIRMSSDIPLARGLGSSAAVIVAGIELADVLCNLNLTRQEKLVLATAIEGHPDNVGASLYGGLVIGCQLNGEVYAETYRNLELEAVVIIPKTELLTKDARDVLPETIIYKKAVQAGAIGNVLIAALLKRDYSLAGKMMKADLYHQPYRKGLVPHLAIIEKEAPKFGAFGVALSGAGPTVLCLTELGKGRAVVAGLSTILPEMEYRCLKIDQVGSTISFSKQNEIRSRLLNS